jgi:hypothetical protein
MQTDQHEGDLKNGVVTCSCGFSTGQHPVTDEAVGEYMEHVNQVAKGTT